MSNTAAAAPRALRRGNDADMESLARAGRHGARAQASRCVQGSAGRAKLESELSNDAQACWRDSWGERGVAVAHDRCVRRHRDLDRRDDRDRRRRLRRGVTAARQRRGVTTGEGQETVAGSFGGGRRISGCAMTAGVFALRRGLGHVRARTQGTEPEDGGAEDPANDSAHDGRSISPSRQASTGTGTSLDRPIARPAGVPAANGLRACGKVPARMLVVR